MNLPEPPARVCVVDDDPTALAAIVAALRADFEVTVARNGDDALRLIGRHPPDVVLLDVEMPGLDGLTLCRMLKDDPLTEPLPVVFLTARSDEETEVRGLAAGAADFIAKPPRGPAMAARVRNLVRLKRLTERMRLESQTDGLTGLHNRAHFDRALDREARRAVRQGQPLALLMVDVDHFKAYNDRYGHPAGDATLRHVARVLNAGVRRAGDLPCRYGGEEFAVLLPATDAVAAAGVARTLVEGMAALQLPHAGSSTAGHVTLSIGAAALESEPAVTLHGDEIAALVARADQALYAAKQNGRNRAWVDAGSGPVAADAEPSAFGREPRATA